MSVTLGNTSPWIVQAKASHIYLPPTRQGRDEKQDFYNAERLPDFVRHEACNNSGRMGTVIKFPKSDRQEKAEGKTLCKSGFHKWKVVTERTFDVKQGKLVTFSRCERCGMKKTALL